MTRANTRGRQQSTRKRKAVTFTEPVEEPVSQEAEKKQKSEYSQMMMTGAELDTLVEILGDDMIPITEEGMTLLNEVVKETCEEAPQVEVEAKEEEAPQVEVEVKEEEKQYRKRRSRVFKPLSDIVMRASFDDSGAYLLPAIDPFRRKLRHAIKTARMMPKENNPYIHEGYFHIRNGVSIVKVPLNGRSAQRYEGASMERGLKALAALDGADIDKVTLSFMNDLGFGSTAARKIRALWTQQGKVVEDILNPPAPYFCGSMGEALGHGCAGVHHVVDPADER